MSDEPQKPSFSRRLRKHARTIGLAAAASVLPATPHAVLAQQTTQGSVGDQQAGAAQQVPPVATFYDSRAKRIVANEGGLLIDAFENIDSPTGHDLVLNNFRLPYVLDGFDPLADRPPAGLKELPPIYLGPNVQRVSITKEGLRELMRIGRTVSMTNPTGGAQVTLDNDAVAELHPDTSSISFQDRGRQGRRLRLNLSSISSLDISGRKANEREFNMQLDNIDFFTPGTNGAIYGLRELAANPPELIDMKEYYATMTEGPYPYIASQDNLERHVIDKVLRRPQLNTMQRQFISDIMMAKYYSSENLIRLESTFEGELAVNGASAGVLRRINLPLGRSLLEMDEKFFSSGSYKITTRTNPFTVDGEGGIHTVDLTPFLRKLAEEDINGQSIIEMSSGSARMGGTSISLRIDNKGIDLNNISYVKIDSSVYPLPYSWETEVENGKPANEMTNTVRQAMEKYMSSVPRRAKGGESVPVADANPFTGNMLGMASQLEIRTLLDSNAMGETLVGGVTQGVGQTIRLPAGNHTVEMGNDFFSSASYKNATGTNPLVIEGRGGSHTVDITAFLRRTARDDTSDASANDIQLNSSSATFSFNNKSIRLSNISHVVIDGVRYSLPSGQQRSLSTGEAKDKLMNAVGQYINGVRGQVKGSEADSEKQWASHAAKKPGSPRIL